MSAWNFRLEGDSINVCRFEIFPLDGKRNWGHRVWLRIRVISIVIRFQIDNRGLMRFIAQIFPSSNNAEIINSSWSAFIACTPSSNKIKLRTFSKSQPCWISMTSPLPNSSQLKIRVSMSNASWLLKQFSLDQVWQFSLILKLRIHSNICQVFKCKQISVSALNGFNGARAFYLLSHILMSWPNERKLRKCCNFVWNSLLNYSSHGLFCLVTVNVVINVTESTNLLVRSPLALEVSNK